MELLILLNYYYYYYQYSTGNQFPVQVTSGKCREPVGGFIRFLMRQSFESEPRQDSRLCSQDGPLILLGLSPVPR